METMHAHCDGCGRVERCAVLGHFRTVICSKCVDDAYSSLNQFVRQPEMAVAFEPDDAPRSSASLRPVAALVVIMAATVTILALGLRP